MHGNLVYQFTPNLNPARTPPGIAVVGVQTGYGRKNPTRNRSDSGEPNLVVGVGLLYASLCRELTDWLRDQACLKITSASIFSLPVSRISFFRSGMDHQRILCLVDAATDICKILPRPTFDSLIRALGGPNQTFKDD